MEGNAPRSILIIGSGVFGLSTAWALAKRPLFASTTITVIDDAGGSFPPPDSASVDSSRIIRADYEDPHYSAMATVAQQEWRKQGHDDLGGQGRYSESGFVMMANTRQDAEAGADPAMEYSRKSWQNVTAYAVQNGYPADRIRAFEGKEALNEYLGTDGHPGDWGYLNTLSGWADAGEGMKWLLERVKATGRVGFVNAKVTELETEGDSVIGARLSDGAVVRADVVVVAAGAWTADLIDLRGRVEATGHVLGYIDLTAEELAVLAKRPVVLNLSSGLFIIPPRKQVLKVAQHGFGYLNPETITGALPPSAQHERKPIVASRPATSRGGGLERLPHEAEADLRGALKSLAPVKGLESRAWKEIRMCWYSDTRDGHWLVDWHPGWKGLFVATGDSGHGFKFLPVLGDKVVDCLLGMGGELGHKWRWKEIEDDGVGKEVDGKFKGLVTRDASRGEVPTTMKMLKE